MIGGERVSLSLVQLQMIASMVHPPHFLLGRRNFLFCAPKMFATLDESSDHPHCFLPLMRPVYLCLLTARLCNLFGLSFAATHNKFVWPHLRLRPSCWLGGRMASFMIRDWSAPY